MPTDALTPAQLAATIDHTLLAATATGEQIDALCAQALAHGFASVCVNGRFVPRVAGALAGSAVKVCGVAGFPLGAMSVDVMAVEAARLGDDGADEVDFVAHLPLLIHQETQASADDWGVIVQAARRAYPQIAVKVILETAALMEGVAAESAEARIAAACDAARAAGVDFVKTSTGFHPAGGAAVEAVELMRRHGAGLRIKASGGIRTLADARAMLAAGADRLGCSAGVAIMAERNGTPA